MLGTSDISVVVSYYNREQYIDETVQSVLAQTLKPLEILIINDCSRESSRRYLDRYSNVGQIIDLPVNVGLAAARNEGMRRARGRFIAFLDDDDVWLPKRLEVQRRYMEEHPACHVVHSAVWAFFSNKADELWKFFGPQPLTLAEALTHDIWVIPSTLLIRTEAMRAMGGFDPRLRQNEDGDFVIRCCVAGYSIEGISEPLARLRREQHARLTRRHVRMYFTHMRLCWKHRKLYYQVYGLRGILSFLLASLHLATRETRYIDGVVRLLLRLVKVKWKVRAQYSEPMLRAKRADVGEPGS